MKKIYIYSGIAVAIRKTELRQSKKKKKKPQKEKNLKEKKFLTRKTPQHHKRLTRRQKYVGEMNKVT